MFKGQVMTKRTFTDEAGNKYELVKLANTGGLVDEIPYALKPIPKAVEKRQFRLKFIEIELGDIDYLFKKEYDLTLAQAQAITDMLEAAMEYVTSETPGIVYVRDAADKARAALQNEGA